MQQKNCDPSFKEIYNKMKNNIQTRISRTANNVKNKTVEKLSK